MGPLKPIIQPLFHDILHGLDMDDRSQSARRSLPHLAAAKAKLEDGRTPLLAIDEDLIIGCFGETQIHWPQAFFRYFERNNPRDLLTSSDRMIVLVADALPGYIISTNIYSATHSNCLITKRIALPCVGYGAHELLPCSIALALISAIQSGN